MPSPIEPKREQIADLCRRFGVRRLELFGSAADGRFDPATSDFDFLVNFDRSADIGPADQYFGLLEGLEALLERKIDLVVEKAIRNPYFLQGVNRARTLLYAA